jgi:crotonobetainyl-CoA:carnitine CoA-transferase CaiB-like acyl-CoA transferase
MDWIIVMSLPLAGIKVLDLSRVLAGPWCTMTLADLGAEIWKIESPKGGDETRKWSPPSVGGVSTYYLSVNRNKRALAIDMGRPEGADIIRALAKEADIFVENFLPKSLQRLGLDYAALRQINPRLIHCSINGYGRGPLENRPGYDFIMQAECGLMAITGTPESGPTRFGVAVTDLVSGMNATQAILAALLVRQSTGVGQSIDISLYRGGIQLLANIASGYLNTEREPVPFGNAHPSIVPYQSFETSGGQLAIAVGTDDQFRKLCRDVLGRTDLAEAPDYATNRLRGENRTKLIEQLSAEFMKHDVEYWLARLNPAGVPAGKVRKVSEAFTDNPELSGDMVVEVPHPELGRVKVVRSPFRFSESDIAEPTHPPLLGEHTGAVLQQVLGFDATLIAGLHDGGAIFDAALANGKR